MYLPSFSLISQRFQYCGVKGTFLGTGLNYKKTTLRNEKMRPPIYMRLIAPLVIPSSLKRQGVHRVYIEYHDHQNEILKVAFLPIFCFWFCLFDFLGEVTAEEPKLLSDGKIKHFYTILAKKLENMGCHFGRCISTYFSLSIKLISLQAVVGPSSTRSRNIWAFITRERRPRCSLRIYQNWPYF